MRGETGGEKMRLIKPSDENEMVLTFLKGEIDSPRFGPQYQKMLRNSNLDRSIINNGNIASYNENQIRKELLGTVRGYGEDSWLFRGFPQNVNWELAELSDKELDSLLYANYSTWITLSAESRLVKDGAKNVDSIITGENANENILAVANAIEAGAVYPALIAASDTKKVVLIEGHVRATAYYLVRPELRKDLQFLIGTSYLMDEWYYF